MDNSECRTITQAVMDTLILILWDKVKYEIWKYESDLFQFISVFSIFRACFFFFFFFVSFFGVNVRSKYRMHYENTPIQIYWKVYRKKKKKKSDKKIWYFSYFYSKHRLWVLVRTASGLTSTHNLCFDQTYGK